MNKLRHCSKCDQTKPITNFNKGTSSGGYHTYCRECQREYERHYWHNRKGRKKKWRNKVNERIQAKRDFILAYLLKHPCVDCGEADPVVLEFDHVRGEKAVNVSEAIHSNMSMKRLQAEIEKCEVRCANCHSIKTAYERGYWLLAYIE